MNNQPKKSGSKKKFYISLFCAAALMVIMGAIGLKISNDQQNSGQDMAQTGNENNNQESQTKNENNSQEPQKDNEAASQDLASLPGSDALLSEYGSGSDLANQGAELEDFSNIPVNETDSSADGEKKTQVFSNSSQPLEEKIEEDKESSSKEDKDKTSKNNKSSKNDQNKNQENEAKETFSTAELLFPEEDGLLWPITGDILLNYSMENGVYFKTLGQYKCNPAILIQGTEGEKVLSSCNGTVKSIEEDEETGLTVTVSAGSDSTGKHYEVIYGQLDNLKVAEGEMISAGQELGTLAKPTKYYVSEGTSLYYEVLEDGEPANPLLLLQ